MDKVRYERVDAGFYRVYVGEKLIALLQKNPNYPNTPWQIERATGGTVVYKKSYDCFSFVEAKRVIKELLVNPALLPDMKERYLQEDDACRCPSCRSVNIRHLDDIDPCGLSAYGARKCDDCNFKWTDVYTITSIMLD